MESFHEDEVRMTKSDSRTVLLVSAIFAVCLSGGLAWSWTPCLAQSGGFSTDSQDTLRRAIDEIRTAPRVGAEYDYIMTARVRLLLFWAGEDDVGGGYIRRGVSADDPAAEFLQIVMGSDPAKAPRAINRWGAAAERVHHAANGGAPESSTFLGFMKIYKGNSPAGMRKELDDEKKGNTFLFSAILNRADRNGSVAKTVPFASDTDFTIHQFDQAEPVVFNHLLNSEGKVHPLDAGRFQACGRPEGFLSTISELVDAALKGEPAPKALCYFYNGQLFKLALTHVSPVEHETVRLSLSGTSQPYLRNYQNLLLAHFENLDETSRQGSSFELLLGTTDALRGVPVRISYQPNWWFQVVLNLNRPEELGTGEIR